MNKLNKKYLAIIVFFFISLVYMFPAFLGKVDTPFDIRNVRMYPWRFHEVDKKIKTLVLWKKEDFTIQIKPNELGNILLNISCDYDVINKIKRKKDANYFVTFDFKPIHGENVLFDFGLSLINNLTGESFTPGSAITPIGQDWHKAFFNLNTLVYGLKSLNDLKNFSLQISTKGKSQAGSAMYVKGLKVSLEDFSNVRKVHNHYNNDLIQMFTPFRVYFSNSLRHGKLPFWNNFNLTGTEFLAEPQVGFFHPLYFLSYLLFDHFTAHLVLTFICLFLSGIGAFILCSYWGLGFFPSLLAGIVYMFQPFNVTWFSYEHMLMNSATLPFLLLAYEKNLMEEKLINKFLLLASLLLGLLFISGHLQYVYYSFLFFFLFVLFKSITSKKNIIKHVFGFLFIFVLGFMIGQMVIFPFLTLFQNSHRTTNPADLVRATSIPLKAFLGLFYPFYNGVPDWPLTTINVRYKEYEDYKLAFMRNYVYFGFLPFVISFFSLKNKLSIFFLFSIFIGILISSGSPVFYVLREIFPGFKEMQHYRFLQIYSMAVPFLAGIGLQEILKYKIKNYFVVFILLFSVVDLMYFSSYFVTWMDRDGLNVVPKNGVIEFIKEKQKTSSEPFRVLPFTSPKVQGAWFKPDIAEPNTLLPYEIEEVSGYSSFIPKDIYYLFVYIQTKDKDKLYSGKIFDLFSNINTPYPISNFHSKILDLLNVKYFIVPNFITIDSPKVKKIFSSDSTVYENLHCLPRAFIVPNYRVIKDPKETIVTLDSEGFNAREEVILENKLTSNNVIARSPPKADDEAIPIEIASPSARNDIQFQKYESNNITLKVKTNTTGFLVLGHNLTNNWKVKVNGKEGKYFKANLVQRAVYLPEAGEYKVEFWYFPKLFLIGGTISILAIFVLGLLAVYLRFFKSRMMKLDR